MCPLLLVMVTYKDRVVRTRLFDSANNGGRPMTNLGDVRVNATRSWIPFESDDSTQHECNDQTVHANGTIMQININLIMARKYGTYTAQGLN